MVKTVLGSPRYSGHLLRLTGDSVGVVCRLIMASSRMFFCVHMEEQPLLCVAMIVSC